MTGGTAHMEPLVDTPLLEGKGHNKNSDAFGAFCEPVDSCLEISTYAQ